MKLQFDSKLDFQKQAVASVVDLFRGQTPNHTVFTVTTQTQQVGLLDTQNGVGNRLELDEEELLKNLQEVQLRNGLPQSLRLPAIDYNFDVEMETGTGKTYVYLRTIMELHKNYGFSKFIIVVPSLAIKEGVYKSLQITYDHFRELYDNVVYNFYIYDSSKLEQVRSFAVSDNIEIMVINIDAFRKSFSDPDKVNKANIIHRENDRMNGMRPIELIQETNPFVIIDEPQSVDTTPKAKEAIKSLNPLCTLRYSATHVDKHHLVYKLDAIDSFELELVKQIEVAGLEAREQHNHAYLKLVSVDNKKSPIKAKIEMDVQDNKGAVKRKVVTVVAGDDLQEKAGGREIYENYVVNEINCEPGNEFLDFTSQETVLRLDKPVGHVDALFLKEQQIRKTIEEHLDKELLLNKQGIKVLSLFFIDKVANYRYYDEQGNPQKGIYAQLFEKHYKELILQPKYATLVEKIDVETPAEEVHDGYFSADKKGRVKDTTGKTQDDETAYNLIMKKKEELLSFHTKLRFIFSHSTLREGWDNPNVFQICTLNDTKSEVKKRQEIGRGLRLCVDQQGQRKHGFSINTLTVMANESYEQFAEALQKEYEAEEGIRFGVIEKHTFANITIDKALKAKGYIGQEASEEIVKHFQAQGYIDSNGKVQDALKKAIKEKEISLPEAYVPVKEAVMALSKKICGSLNIKNNSDKRNVELNKQVFLDPEFKTLWDKVKYKTTYSVDFDTEELVEEGCRAMRKELSITSPKLVYTKARLEINVGGVQDYEVDRSSVSVKEIDTALPDIIAYLQNATNLTRKTIVKLLVDSKTLHLFKKNPQQYMEQAAQIITAKMRSMIVDGIKYTKIGEDAYYAQELFEEEELTGYLKKNMLASQKSVFQYVVYDSDVEESFATSFENNNRVKLYAKLPNWFKIPTPLGSYNPDWAVLIEKDGTDKLYFVVETKGSILEEKLRPMERSKIECGRKHFEALNHDVAFTAADNFEAFIEDV